MWRWPLAAFLVAMLFALAGARLGVVRNATGVACAGEPFPRECNIVFVETTNAAVFPGLGRLVFRVDYPNDKLDFGQDPIACTLHEQQVGATAMFTNDAIAGTLRAELSRDNGLFLSPLVVCTPRGTEDAQSLALNITVTESRDLNGDLLEEPAVVDDETFSCSTTTVPTTTLPETTTTDGAPTTTIETTTTTEQPTTTTLPAAICGDANDDGTIDAADALLALRTAVGLATCAPERCDTNADANLNAADSLRILRKAVGLPEALDCSAGD